MAITAAVACVWSGVETTTASSRGPSSWSSSRKSLYFLASLCFSPLASSRFWSMSQIATIRPWWAAWSVSLAPLPPTPMQAIFSVSFGPTPPAQPLRPGARMPKPATDAPNRNDRRFVVMLIVLDSRTERRQRRPGPRGRSAAQAHSDRLVRPLRAPGGQSKDGRPRRASCNHGRPITGDASRQRIRWLPYCVPDIGWDNRAGIHWRSRGVAREPDRAVTSLRHHRRERMGTGRRRHR